MCQHQTARGDGGKMVARRGEENNHSGTEEDRDPIRWVEPNRPTQQKPAEDLRCNPLVPQDVGNNETAEHEKDLDTYRGIDGGVENQMRFPIRMLNGGLKDFPRMRKHDG